MDDLKNLSYGISFDVTDDGFAKAIDNENRIDSGFKTAAMSATKVDENMLKAASSTSKTGTNAKKINDELGNTIPKSKTLSDHMKNISEYSEKSNKMMDSFKSIVLSLGAGMGIASLAKSYTDFEQTMANVRATMGEVSDKDFKELQDAALELGSKTEYSSQQVAEAMFYTASAGFDTKTQLEVLPSVLNLASAGQIDLAKSSDILTTSMSSLKLNSKGIPTLVDQMAVAAQASLTDIDHMGDAITNVGGVAKQANLSTADLNAELSILANSGKKGADGGVALRNVLLNLTAPNEQVSKLMKELGVHITDTNGKIRPFNDILVDLKDKMKGLSQGTQMGILETIGGKENVEALNILLSGSGDQFEKLKKQILDSSGAAQRMADVQRDTVAGSFKLLKNSVDSAFIKNIDNSELGITLKGFFKYLTAIIPKAANEINFLIKTIKENKSTILSIISALAGFTIIFKIIGMIGEFQKALDIFKKGEKAVNGFGKVMGLLTNPVFYIVLAIAALIGILVYAYKTNDSFRKTVNNLFSALKTLGSFIMGTIVPILAGPFSAIWNSVKSLISNFITIVEGVFKILSGLINFVVGVFTGNWKQAWEGIKQVFSGIFDALKGVLAGFFNFFTSGINGAIGLVNGLVSKIPGIGSLIPKIPTIPNVQFKNAAGTDYSPGGWSLVGEYGPELRYLDKGTKVKTANETSSILNQSIRTSQPINRSTYSNVIKSNPVFQISINESTTPKETSEEIIKRAKKEIDKYWDEKFAQLTIQMGYGGVN